MRLRTRKRMVIDSAWLVRALAGSRKVHTCDDCDSRMFVKGPSGLCPICLTSRRQRDEHTHEIAAEEATAALSDWGY